MSVESHPRTQIYPILLLSKSEVDLSYNFPRHGHWSEFDKIVGNLGPRDGILFYCIRYVSSRQLLQYSG